jgi:hypothetical protein
MSDYVKATNFAVKDTLSTGNAAKLVKGTELNSEFDAIATAVQTKINLNNPSFTGTMSGGTIDGGTY